MLGPAVSRLENLGKEGATVNSENSWLLEHLDYSKASEDDLHIERHEFYFDKNVSNPLMWRPLYFGGLGFAQRHYHGNVCVLA